MPKMFRKIQYNAPVTLTFTLLALASLLLGIVTKNVSTKLFFSSFRTSFIDPMQYIRMFSYVLGHINWTHFYGNFLIILMLGPMLEEKYGSKALIKMILLTALITGLIHIILSNSMLIGASGIVYMFIILSSFTNAERGRIPLTLIILFGIFVGKEIYSGAFSQDNISQLAHILGGICGALFGFRMKH